MTPFQILLQNPRPLLALAPMQDISDLAFWSLIDQRGSPDLFYTEYFRVHATSRLDRTILQSILQSPPQRLVIAQIIGNDARALVRAARELQQYRVAAIDFNLGCPAPIVYRKWAGGGLLRDLPRVEALLQALRQSIAIPFTIKTRIGFDSGATWDDLLAIFSRCQPDLVAVHGRTVLQAYRGQVDYAAIARAAAALSCPVLANGDIVSPVQACHILAETGVRGLMLGRGAIRNPWIFQQIQQALVGRPLSLPDGRQVAQYLLQLYEASGLPVPLPRLRLEKFKKYLNFVGPGLDSSGLFLHRARRLKTESEMLTLFQDFLDHPHPMPLTP